jgi:hypothetical protein
MWSSPLANGIYICTVDDRLVTGRGLWHASRTSPMIDPRSGDVVGRSARDIPIAVAAFREDQASSTSSPPTR